MRKSKIYVSALTLALGSLFSTSCNDDKDQPAALDAVVDVFAQKTMIDGEAKFALGFFVVANKNLESVSVKNVDNNEKTYSLIQDENDSNVFTLYPEDSTYTTTSPELGDYEFTINSTETDEAEIERYDELIDEELDTVSINSIEVIDDELTATWDTIEGAENFVVKLYDAEDNLIFSSSAIDLEATEFTFGLDSNGWIGDDKAEETESYKLELVAILYESGVTQDKYYNLQYISIDSEDLIWGE